MTWADFGHADNEIQFGQVEYAVLHMNVCRTLSILFVINKVH